MTTLEHCPTLNCWLRANHHGPHGQTGRPGTHLVCICPTPQPTTSDMCARCLRVIANLIHQRRQTR